jgi:hypothetical protein
MGVIIDKAEERTKTILVNSKKSGIIRKTAYDTR